MDKQIEYSLKDITESFKTLSRFESPMRDIPIVELTQLRKFHVTRIQLNLEALRKLSEDYSNV